MFLNSVILILQEMIEAALLISVLLVFTQLFQKSWDECFVLRSRWVVISFATGIVGASMYSYYTPQIAEMFDYVGQEIFNAGIHILSLLLICLLAFMVPSTKLLLSAAQRSRSAAFCMVGIVMFSITREGSEIIQYVGGIAGQEGSFTPVVVGGFIGAGIGISTGVLLYYFLINLTTVWSFRLSLLLLCLIAGNMGSQAVLLLTQADWLPYTAIAWNSSSALPENSVVGHLLYALIGYEATPSILQVSIYLLGIISILVSPLFREFWPQKHSVDGES